MRIAQTIPLIILILGGLLVVTLTMYGMGKYRCENNPKQRQSTINYQYAWFTFGMIMMTVGVGIFVYSSIKGKPRGRAGGIDNNNMFSDD
jgi:uncharacterized membrane protein